MKKLLTMLLLSMLSLSTITTFAIQAPAQHLKKDGTPDKRYKKTTPAPAQHLKKDGTPDKRYKENKPKKS